MGYNLYITRASHWHSNTDCVIEAHEWLEIVKDDPELHIDEQQSNGLFFTEWNSSEFRSDGWFDLSSGNIYTKNPDEKTISKMIAIARLLNANVQGEESEIYSDNNGTINSKQFVNHRPAASEPTLFQLILDLIRRRRRVKENQVIANGLNFRPSDRVKDVWGNEATVVKVVPNDGLGLVQIRYDDGRISEYTLIGHPFEKIQ